MADETNMLTILPKPQISVFVNSNGDVGITVTSMSDDLEKVDINEIFFPRECAKEVGKALLELAKTK